MIRDELKVLFEKDTRCFDSDGISETSLNIFDEFILNRADDSFNREILNVYGKFIAMKQQAPENMKTVLFSTISSYSKDEASKGNYLGALVLFRFLIVKSAPDSLDYLNAAKNLVKLGDDRLYPEFLKIYSKKEENKLLSYIELADFYKGIDDYKNAIDCYEKFLEVDKTKVSIYTITADLYSKLYGSEALECQIELYEQAYKLQSDNRLVLHGLAFSYEKLGRDTMAKIYYEKLIQNNPTENDLFNYGCFLIHCGDFVNGHKYFTHRFNIDDINLKYPSDESKKWDFQSDISDKTLLVHYEQGFGDTIMYCRFVPFLKKIAKKVIFVVQNELYDLISNSHLFEGVEIATEDDNVQYDVNMALLDVLYVLKFDTSAVDLLKTKYLDISKEKVESYKNKYFSEDKSLKIGLSCSGEENANYNDRNIEISKIYNLLKDIPNIKLYDLQKNSGEYNGIIPLGNVFGDFTESACAVKNMDLIITTDNVILNLAGALGVKTIALFNKETNYRWYRTKEENVGWYESVKPLQNEIQNDWSEVFSKLLNLVCEFLKEF